ncbi:MAG: hypothetical protein FWD53_05570 [Phycisphaerales bacterium]|nr:hypothetical protein [Phycisphaerales bacterium]
MVSNAIFAVGNRHVRPFSMWIRIVQSIFALPFVLVMPVAVSAVPPTAAPVELTMSQVVSELAASLNQVQTYFVTGSVTSNSEDYYRVDFETGWERIPGSGLEYTDKRFFVEKIYDSDKEAIAGEPAEVRTGIYNGKVSYYQDEQHKREKEKRFVSRRGEAENNLTLRLLARGLTFASLATHISEVTPIEQVVANGTFELSGLEEIEGRRCAVIYGKYALAGQPDCKKGTPGMYLRFWLDVNAGYMPIRQERYAVRDPGVAVNEPFSTLTATLREIQKGVWLPISGTRQDKGIDFIYQLKVDKLEANPTFAPDRFQIKWAPGAHVNDKAAGVQFTMPLDIPPDLDDLLKFPEPSAQQRTFQQIENKLVASREGTQTQKGEDRTGRPLGQTGLTSFDRQWILWSGIGMATFIAMFVVARRLARRRA